MLPTVFFVLAAFLWPASAALLKEDGPLEERTFDFDADSTDTPLWPKNGTEEDSLAKCRLDQEEGVGNEHIPRFFFNSTNQTCSPFVYKGNSGNANNFGSELDCLAECYSGVKEGPKIAEEDVVLINSRETRQSDICALPKNNGVGRGTLQRFYFDSDLNTCLAFKYHGKGGNDNRFEKLADCESRCRHIDGSACQIDSPVPAKKSGFSCQDTVCPNGYSCLQGAFMPECCSTSSQDTIRELYNEKCADGQKAAGQELDGLFRPLVARTCADLVCQPKQRCVQVLKRVAKCCPATGSSFLHDQPLPESSIPGDLALTS